MRRLPIENDDVVELNAAAVPARLLVDAQIDYRMCVEEGFIGASPRLWQAFLAGYLGSENARASREKRTPRRVAAAA